MSLLDVSPDGSTLLAADEIGATAFSGYLWEVPVLGESARKLGNAFGHAAAWSPDGKMIVYAHERDLFFANRDGSQPHKLIALPDQANEPVWSPDGKAIRFRVGSARSPSRPGALWEISVDGTNLHALLPPGWRNPPQECCGKWSADGRYFIFQSHGNIWARAEKASWFGKAKTASRFS